MIAEFRCVELNCRAVKHPIGERLFFLLLRETVVLVTALAVSLIPDDHQIFKALTICFLIAVFVCCVRQPLKLDVKVRTTGRGSHVAIRWFCQREWTPPRFCLCLFHPYCVVLSFRKSFRNVVTV
jgi:hypothetical protein